VIVSGGLGPTEDDLTRDAVAAVLGVTLIEDSEVLERIRRRFAGRAVHMPEINARQALVPVGAEAIVNEHGTAPGLWIETGDRLIVLLPGPPGELKPMFDRLIEERLAPRMGGTRVYRRVLLTCGRTESEVDELLFPLYARWTTGAMPVSTTVLTAPAQVELHLTLCAGSERAARERLDAVTDEARTVLGADLVSDDGRSLEAVLGDLLKARAWTIAVAESCTGGLVSARLTNVPGSSTYVSFNAVCYSNAAKIAWVDVPEALIAAHGAVSEPVALAMAHGIRGRARADTAIGVTGIAGPSGGTPLKPVGTVAIAAVTADAAVVRTYRFPGDRLRVRQFAAGTALDLARRLLVGAEPGRGFVVSQSQV
jgi:nicotinamide-nucleotide amidase